MRKKTIKVLFLGSLLGLFGGALFTLTAIVVAARSDAFVMDGPDVVGVHGDALSWVLVGVVLLGGLAMVVSAVVQFVAWIGAVLTTATLPDKTWFVVLLVSGVATAGILAFVGLLAYVVAGPEEPPAPPPPADEPSTASRPRVPLGG